MYIAISMLEDNGEPVGRKFSTPLLSNFIAEMVFERLSILIRGE